MEGDGRDVCSFDLAEILEPALRRRLAEGASDAVERAVTERGEDAARATPELLRRAIEARREVIEQAERERQARWILEEARGLSDSLDADAVRLKARRRLERARRRGVEARARACRMEALAHLSRLGERPSEVEQSIRAALDAYLWLETWQELAKTAEPHPTEASLASDAVRARLGEELALLFLPPEPSASTEPERRVRLRRFHDRLREVRAAARGAGGFVPPSDHALGSAGEAAAEPPPSPVSDAPVPPRDRPGRSPFIPVSPASSPMPSVGASLGLVARAMSGVSGGPRGLYDNAFCAVCGASYELPPETSVTHTHCGACGAGLIPADAVSPIPRMRMSSSALCPGCGRGLTVRSSHRHVRCAACGAAVAPVFLASLDDGRG